MRLIVVDGEGELQTVIAQSVDVPVDASGACAGGATQPLLAANPLRAGWIFQNTGGNQMFINEIGEAASNEGGSFTVLPGQTFPPPGYPVVVTQINVLGTDGDTFTCREWSSPADTDD